LSPVLLWKVNGPGPPAHDSDYRQCPDRIRYRHGPTVRNIFRTDTNDCGSSLENHGRPEAVAGRLCTRYRRSTSPGLENTSVDGHPVRSCVVSRAVVVPPPTSARDPARREGPNWYAPRTDINSFDALSRGPTGGGAGRLVGLTRGPDLASTPPCIFAPLVGRRHLFFAGSRPYDARGNHLRRRACQLACGEVGAPRLRRRPAASPTFREVPKLPGHLARR